jgi:tetratricopeptide (TPR) repeat protein
MREDAMDRKNWWQPLVFTLLGLVITAGIIYGVVCLAGAAFSVPDPQTGSKSLFNTISTSIMVLSLAGGLGGLCYSLIENRRFILCHIQCFENEKDKKPDKEGRKPEDKVKDENRDKSPGLDLGGITDIWIGIGSAFAVFFVLSGLITMTKDITSIEPSTIFVLAGMGVVAGAGGKAIFPLLIDKMKDMITKKIAEEADKKATEAQEEVKKLATRASVRSMVSYSAMRKIDGDLPGAIEACTQAIEVDPDYADAYYHRACYRSLSNQPLKDILDDLKQAIAKDETCRQDAKEDKDFESIKDELEFKKIVDKSQ